MNREFSVIQYLAIFLAFISCQFPSQNAESDGDPTEKVVEMTIARVFDSTGPGSAYVKNVSRYYVISNGDTSSYKPEFSILKKSGSVVIDERHNYLSKNKSFKTRKKELKLILDRASEDYNLDSLSRIYLGRLILQGDLAVRLTQEYIIEFGENYEINTSDYNRVKDFLNRSSLRHEIDELANPYSKEFKSVSIEKVFFASKNELLNYSEVSSDTSEIPDRILDCLIGVSFQDAMP